MSPAEVACRPQGNKDHLVSYYQHGEALRSRSVSEVVLRGWVDVPAPPVRLVADWRRDITHQLGGDHGGLQPGDVETLPLPRARARWPDYQHCVKAVADWTRSLGLGDVLGGVLASSEVALMACRGARYHHDAAQYGGAAFCNLFLCDTPELDVHFPAIGLRIPLVRGTVVVFDTGQPHAVIARSSNAFDAADFPPEHDCTQVFLTWELPIGNPQLSQALKIAFDIEPARALLLPQEQLWRNGMKADVCPATGHWQPLD